MTKQERRNLENLICELRIDLGRACNDLEAIILTPQKFTKVGLAEIARHADRHVRKAVEALCTPDADFALQQAVQKNANRAHGSDRGYGSEDWHAPHHSDLHAKP
jgi:hypothetical protein